MNDVGRGWGKKPPPRVKMIAATSGMGVSVPNEFCNTADARLTGFVDQGSGVNQRDYELDKTNIDDVSPAGSRRADPPVDYRHSFSSRSWKRHPRCLCSFSSDDENASFACVPPPRRKICQITSFAGQQETFLNVQGFDAVLVAVKRICFSVLTIAPSLIAFTGI